jgi:phage portal protein BeeE
VSEIASLDGITYIKPPSSSENHRGVTVYTIGELIGISGKNKKGNIQYGPFQDPYRSFLTPHQIELIIRRSWPILSVIGKRQGQIGTLEISVKHESEGEDHRTWEDLKQSYTEWIQSPDPEYQIAAGYAESKIREHFPEIIPGLGNFDTAMRRAERRQKRELTQKKNEIMNWLYHPNPTDTWQEFVEKWVQSAMGHGKVAIYKKWVGGILDSMYVLPGGSVTPERPYSVGEPGRYVQIVQGHENKYYAEDEISFSVYRPSASISIGYTPIEAIIDQIAAGMLQFQFVAKRADGSAPPETLVVLGEKSDLSGDLTEDITVDTEEQARVEEKLNIARENAVAVLQGVGTPVVLDLSKGSDMPHLPELMRLIISAVGSVFQATPMEMNLGGSDYTSGRSTAEAQAEIARNTAVLPLMKKLGDIITYEILPLRYGPGWELQWPKGMSEADAVALENAKMQTGTYTADEIRQARGAEPKQEGGSDSLPATAPGAVPAEVGLGQ